MRGKTNRACPFRDKAMYVLGASLSLSQGNMNIVGIDIEAQPENKRGQERIDVGSKVPEALDQDGSFLLALSARIT